MLITAEALAFACFGIGQGILSGGGAPSAHLGQPGVARAVVFTGLCLALFGLLGMGIGVILRHTAGAISAYIAIAFLLPLLLHQVGGDPTRYSPLQIMINSVSVTVVTHGQVSPIVGLLLMVAYATAALVAGAFMFVARDA
jgi:ABC-2 type transport system permease protein